MKNSSLEKFKSFEMTRSAKKITNGGGNCCDAMDNCIDTAENDGNEWLIPECTRILAPCCFS